MTDFSLQANLRQRRGKQVRKIRTEGNLPAVVYGHSIETMSVDVPLRAFEKVYRSAHGSHLIDLKIDGKEPIKVLVHETQRHPLTDQVIHVDFLKVSMAEKITAEIPVKIIGESPAVKEKGGTLLKNITEVTISCMPDKLIDEIVIDISKLLTFDDVVTLGSLGLPEGIEVVGKSEEVVVMITPPRSDEELASLEQKVEENVETVESAKKKEPTEDEEVVAEDKPKAEEAPKK